MLVEFFKVFFFVFYFKILDNFLGNLLALGGCVSDFSLYGWGLINLRFEFKIVSLCFVFIFCVNMWFYFLVYYDIDV